MLKPSEKTKEQSLSSIRTKIPTLIDNIEHDVSLTITIYLYQVYG